MEDVLTCEHPSSPWSSLFIIDSPFSFFDSMARRKLTETANVVLVHIEGDAIKTFDEFMHLHSLIMTIAKSFEGNYCAL